MYVKTGNSIYQFLKTSFYLLHLHLNGEKRTVCIVWHSRRIRIGIRKPVLITSTNSLTPLIGTNMFSHKEKGGRLYKSTDQKSKKKIISLCKINSVEDLQFHTVQGPLWPAVVKPLFQATDDSRQTCGEMPTSVNTLTGCAVSETGLWKGDPGNSWLSFFKLWVQAWRHTLGLFDSRETERLFKCH